MRKIRLNESQFNRLVSKCVKKVLKENEERNERFWFDIQNITRNTTFYESYEFETLQEAIKDGKEYAIEFMNGKYNDACVLTVYGNNGVGMSKTYRQYEVYDDGVIERCDGGRNNWGSINYNPYEE